jgi:hypothetical protein
MFRIVALGLLLSLFSFSALLAQEQLMPCRRGEFYGFCDARDQVRIPAVYHMALTFEGELAPVVCSDMQWWMIDRKGVLRFNSLRWHDQAPLRLYRGVYTVRFSDPVLGKIVSRFNRHGLPVRVLHDDSLQADTLVYEVFSFSRAAARARALLGRSYGTDSLDVTGFIRHVFAGSGIFVPFYGKEIALAGQPVERSAVRPGDLVFFEGETTGTKEVNHIGFVLSVEGSEITFVHASPSSGVQTEKISSSYFSRRFLFARRLFG